MNTTKIDIIVSHKILKETQAQCAPKGCTDLEALVPLWNALYDRGLTVSIKMNDSLDRKKPKVSWIRVETSAGDVVCYAGAPTFPEALRLAAIKAIV